MRPPWSPASWGAEVTVVGSDGLGGSAVLTDVVPCKTLIATAELMTDGGGAGELGRRAHDDGGDVATTVERRPGTVNDRVKRLAAQQSEDIAARLDREDIRVVRGRGRLDGPSGSWSRRATAREQTLDADAILVATAPPRARCPPRSPTASGSSPGSRSTTSTRCRTKLVVVGSGVTGAEFASAYLALGVDVTLVSSRDRVLPGEDADAALVLEDVLTRRGMKVLSKSRMAVGDRAGTP